MGFLRRTDVGPLPRRRSLPIERPGMGIWVGRYAIVAGDVREHGPWLVERSLSRDDEEVRLFVLADPVDERSYEFSTEVAEAVAELFARESLSITGGLLRALRQAHANLAEWNRRSLREHQVAVGLTCVATRAGEATIAQVGSGVVYIAGPEGIRRLSTAGEPAERPIGGHEPIEPQFFSTPLEDRTLLLLTGSVDQLVGTNTVGEALTAGAERTLSELYRRTRGVSDMAAVLLAEVDFDEDDVQEPEDDQRASIVESELDADVESELEAGATYDLPPVLDDLTPRHEQEPEPFPAREERPTLPALAPAPAEPESSRLVDSGVQRDREPVLGAKRFPSLRRQTTSLTPSNSQSRGLSRAGTGLTSGIRRHGGRRLQGYALIGLALIAVVALAVCTLPSLLEEDRGAQLNDAIVAAQEHIAAAAETDEPATIRTELEAALAEISRGRSIDADDVRLAALQEQADSGLARLNAVVDLGAAGLRRVVAFDGTVTAPFTPRTVISGGDAPWLIDSEQGRVFRVPTDGQGEATEVYRLDSTYGDVAAGQPSAIAFDSLSGSLLVLDDERNLFVIEPDAEPDPLGVRDIEDIESAVAIASYDGNLYVLDPAGGEIWRYLPGGDGFDSERTNMLGGLDIGDARALLVDGEFYLLGAAGVRHFRGDRELPPLLQGLDRPLSSPAGFVRDSERGLTYVADRGGRRVVVSDGEGNYLKQYRHPQFFDLRGIALSSDGTTVYALTGDGIYAFTPAF